MGFGAGTILVQILDCKRDMVSTNNRTRVLYNFTKASVVSFHLKSTIALWDRWDSCSLTLCNSRHGTGEQIRAPLQQQSGAELLPTLQASLVHPVPLPRRQVPPWQTGIFTDEETEAQICEEICQGCPAGSDPWIKDLALWVICSALLFHVVSS